ncbi:MAG: hypothetical protein IKE43_04290 [Coriobacteriales bacterium]|nr:hypothetical protein [Coriobacteriales bacterium]
MQSFSDRIGWARWGLLIGAALLVVMGVLCFVAHGIMPHAMHNTGLPSGYPTGELIGALAMAVVGISHVAAYYLAGGSKNLGGWLILEGIMALAACIACLVDPMLGTFSYEWVIAVFIALLGVMVFLSGVCGGRVIGFKGWMIEAGLGIVLVCLGLGVVINSAYAATLAGIAFFVYAGVILVQVFMPSDLKLKY